MDGNKTAQATRSDLSFVTQAKDWSNNGGPMLMTISFSHLFFPLWRIIDNHWLLWYTPYLAIIGQFSLWKRSLLINSKTKILIYVSTCVDDLVLLTVCLGPSYMN
jgi:hypothetical protein